ncbi:MAG: type II toxin-antitoxin system RelE/ParE family toxin [Candidatus Methylomirabilales bacterium]
MPNEATIAAVGPRITVEWVVDLKGAMPAREFYLGLSRGDQAKVMALFRRLADFGQISNREKFKQLGPKAGEKGRGLWEFKSGQIRLIGDFRPGGRFLVAHGTVKKADDLPKQDIERAIRILAEHDAREGQGGVKP